jgi:hypothetical protein
MDPKELKENFTAQLEKATGELAQLRQAVAQREALVLKLQGAIEAMAIQLPPEEGDEAGAEGATEGGAEDAPLAQAEVV